MKDCEFEILTLHKESQHLREMQDLLHKPHDVADAHQTITESLLRGNSRQLEDLSGKADILVVKLNSSSRRCCTGKAKAIK